MPMTALRLMPSRAALACIATCAALSWPMQAHALFSDDEARKAVIDVRQRLDAAQATINELKQNESTSRRSLLELSNLIEQLRSEIAQVRGQNEQLARQVADLQRMQKDAQQGMEQRLREMEPATVSLDGREFQALPAEKREYEVALEALRASDFPRAEAAFESFLRKYPDSGFSPSVLYWLGNAQYANGKYRDAIGSHRRLVNGYPTHPRTPEAMLAVANSQIELKDIKSARRTLEDLVKAHPKTEAAAVARDRLARLR